MVEEAKLTHQANKRDLDEKTVVASALNMMVAGYDTTSNLLSITMYYLALYPGAVKVVHFANYCCSF